VGGGAGVRNAQVLVPIIVEWVEPGTLIVSDGWAAYGGRVAAQAYAQNNFAHAWVNHRFNFVDPLNPQVHTQSIEATWGAIKYGLKHLRGTTDLKFPGYLQQYMFVRAHNRIKIFQNLLFWIAVQNPV